MAQLMTNPKARELLKDPETAMLMRMMQEQPNNTSLLTNSKLLKLIQTVFGIDIGTGNENENDNDTKMETDTKPTTTKKETNTSISSKPSTTTTTNKTNE
ncbi:unnamed protein product [Rotaria sordida]|uniref:STI1 domain-containing protein n=1 Tax=Rotaria sordida TaxID=392033 RepID=A0A818PZ59_9BILA|nr:unnamed protein product [Rotaria sordida]CAF1347102.1 unnamed protein product [Rotaria sordida]CAF3631418.1 unnamed protein product [Rotaria sordida]CAF3687445.1 unnamed protein product [Rotaria sordida]